MTMAVIDPDLAVVPDAKALYFFLEEEGEGGEGRKRNNKKKSTITTLSLGDDKFLDLDEETGKPVGLEVLFAQDLPQEAVDAIINSPERIAVLNTSSKKATG